MAQEDTPSATPAEPSGSPAPEASAPATESPAGGSAPQRQASGVSAAAALKHMRQSAKDAIRRTEDFTSELMLPISCILLIIAIWIPGIPQVKAVIFLAPLFAFLYYLRLRIGIACTFNKRQAYLTWHILIATFLLGGTASLVGVYVVAYLTRIALGMQSS